MQSDDPFAHHARNGLSAEFEYDPFSSENYYLRPTQSLGEPDEFYRPFAERSQQPDIVVQSDEGIMAAQTKRRQSNVAGTPSKTIPSSTTASTPRSSNRSVSGPAGPRPAALSSAKSVPSLGTSASRNGLIKERVRHFDKSKESSLPEGSSRHRTRTPSISNNAAGANRSSPQRVRLTKGRSNASPKVKADTNNRRPLFGEVLDTNTGTDDAGYGISEIKVDEEGSMHHPNAMFSRSRSHSDLDSSLPQADHHRSYSHDSVIPQTQDYSSSTTSPDNPASPTSPTFQNTLSPSRIPIRTRRASDIGSTNGAARHRPPPAAPSHKAPSSHASQTLLSSRRYSPPKKYLDPNNSLTAMVRPPPQKTSPPLRSMKTRAPVNAATTAATRAKVTERFKPASSSSSPSDSKPKPQIPGVDIAERRARLQKSLQGGTHARPLRQDLKNLQDGKYSSRRPNWVDADAVSDVSDSLSSRKSSTSQTVPILSIETVDRSEDQRITIHSAGADTEFEESPVLGYENGQQFPSQSSPISPDEVIGPSNEREDSQGLLRHVLNLRQVSPGSTPRTEVPDDYLTQVDDGATINIMLGATPRLPSHNWSPEAENPGSSPEAFHTPREDNGSDGEGDMFDNRSSIYPDDSISMVGQRRYIDRMAHEPVPPLPTYLPQFVKQQNFTLTSDARSEINRVLDQYQEGQITPELAHGFQRKVEALTPNLSRHDAWESPEATRHYLKTILDSPSISESPQEYGDSPAEDMNYQRDADEETEFDGGIAIIYTAGHDTDAPLERTTTLHSHSTSNATLRPSKDETEEDNAHKSYLEDLVFRPAPPPKDDPSRITDIPSLPELSRATSGLGLSMEVTPVNTPPRSPHPPLPLHAPPAPPTPLRDEMSLQGALSPGSTQHRLPFDPFSPGLPASPAASRGRPQNIAVDTFLHEDSQSAKASLELSATSRNQSPYSIGRSTNGDRLSQCIATPDMEKELTQRRHRVKELVDTEHSFHQDLTIMTDIYLATAADVLQEEDRRTLFGNIEQLRSFTTEFLDALKRAATPIYVIPRENRWNYKRGSFTTSNSENTENSSTLSIPLDERLENDRRTFIGQVFCEHLTALQRVYSEWLKNASAANKRLVELQRLPAVKYWLDECLESHKDLTTAWNLDSLLVKPFQRSAKYTLLLDEILRYTSPEHPDYTMLKQAKDLVKAYNERANDMQKRTELVEQAMSKNKDPNGRIKVGKLLNRRTEKLKQQVGLSGQAEDPDYDAIVQKFGGHFFQLQVVMRDVEKYLEDVQQHVNQYVEFMEALTGNASVDAMIRYPEAESRWIDFWKAIVDMRNYALVEHVKNVRKCVIDPIQQLWRLHVGPQKMMAKRKKRLVEYVRHKNMVEKGEKPDKRLEQDAEQFRAVNDTLKEELPKLYALTKKLVDNCLANFIELQVTWQSIWSRKLGPLIDDIDQTMGMELPQSLVSISAVYMQDISEVEDQISTFKLCNKVLVTEARNLKSPATTYSRDDESSLKRPSTLGSAGGKRAMSLSSDQAAASTPNFRLSGDNMALSPLIGTLGMPDGIYQGANGRIRATSALSSRGPSTPYSPHAHVHAQTYGGHAAYPYPRAGPLDRSESSPALPRLSLDSPMRSPLRADFGPPYVVPDHRLPISPAPADDRFSGVFHSALPMSDSPRAQSPNLEENELHVLFLAASLFEFHIDSTRKEGGYPYLTYQPGEIFDVVAQKGELWLARNQDDSTHCIGWIWEKHFARILPEN